jgi:hypothetical protein
MLDIYPSNATICYSRVNCETSLPEKMMTIEVRLNRKLLFPYLIDLKYFFDSIGNTQLGTNGIKNNFFF